MPGKTLWAEFNLGENNKYPDPSGGLMYCLRYGPERIKAHQGSVVAALKSFGISLEEVAGRITVNTSGRQLSESEQDRVLAMLEELSCLNEGLGYVKAGFGNYRTVAELAAGLKTHYFTLLLENKKPAAYDLVTGTIPEIVRSLKSADFRNHILYSSERSALEELTSFAQNQAKFLNRPTGFVVVH